MAAVVGVTLLEVIRRQDLPTEVLEAEDPSVTMPRRLGLSDVIERQIRAYREDMRRGRKLTDDEFRDLVHLVIRRPDGEEVFYRAGRALALGDDEAVHASSPPRQGWRKVLPKGMAFFLARRRVSARLRSLFGRKVGGFANGPLHLEARQHILYECDPGGDACAFATGLAEAVVRRYAGPGWRVVHGKCQAHKDAVCKWTVLAEEGGREKSGVRELQFSPEPGTS